MRRVRQLPSERQGISIIPSEYCNRSSSSWSSPNFLGGEGMAIATATCRVEGSTGLSLSGGFSDFVRLGRWRCCCMRFIWVVKREDGGIGVSVAAEVSFFSVGGLFTVAEKGYTII